MLLNYLTCYFFGNINFNLYFCRLNNKLRKQLLFTTITILDTKYL